MPRVSDRPKIRGSINRPTSASPPTVRHAGPRTSNLIKKVQSQILEPTASGSGIFTPVSDSLELQPLSIAPIDPIDDPEPVMVYTNWNNSHNVQSYSRFVSLEELMAVLNNIRRYSFFVHKKRAEAEQMIRDLTIYKISKTVRFPNFPCADITNSFTADQIDSITSALDFNERSEEQTHITGAKYSSLNDAKRSYGKSVQRISEIVAKVPSSEQTIFGIYSRETFEAKFNLTAEV